MTAFEQLTAGPTQQLGALNRSQSGGAGVFTVWVDQRLVFFGVAGSAAEAKQSNHAQADGVIGRIRKFGQQPGSPTVRRLRRHFDPLWNECLEDTDELTSRSLLRKHAVVRIVRLEDRVAADELLEDVRCELDAMLLSD